MLTDFFRINLPYGMENVNGNWIAFNRDYKPLGVNTRDLIDYSKDKSLLTGYPKLDEKLILQLTKDHPERMVRNEQGEIIKFWLYHDGSNPMNFDTKANWDSYFDKLKKLATLSIYKN